MSNNTNTQTFRELFENRRDIQIPVYQRSYSWRKKEECKQFFEDLVEQDGKPYHLGLFIFEHEHDAGAYFVIDGQQRLTTAVLFLAALVKVNLEKNENLADIRETYLSGSFSTVEDDDAYFQQLIKEFSCGEMKAKTIAQSKIKEAFDFFVENLEKIDFEKAANLRQSLESAKIGIFDIDDKGEASQVFEYQNNRGIPASEFEIIKAYLVHQIYINSADPEADIKEIQKNIPGIYRNFDAISEHFNEDDILRCWFDLYEYEQNNNNKVDDIKWILSPENKDKPVEDICGWVKGFFINFEEITIAAKTLVSKTSRQISNLFLIGKKPYWPVIMLAVILKEGTRLKNERLNEMAKLLEILWFKYEYCNRRIDSLPEWAYKYFNKKSSEEDESSEENFSFDNLFGKIKEAIDSGFDGKFPEFKKAVSDYLGEADHFRFKAATRYVLWQYENSLRKEKGSPILGDKKYDTYNTIEHIQPQDTELSYVHRLGNLTLLRYRDNSKASDKDFDVKKQEVYSKYFDRQNPDKARLLQFRDILSKKAWREQEVKERFGKIKEFVKEYFKAPENE